MHVLRSRVLQITAISNKIRGPMVFVITEFDCIWEYDKEETLSYNGQIKISRRNLQMF
jgi:hypothetical protein